MHIYTMMIFCFFQSLSSLLDGRFQPLGDYYKGLQALLKGLTLM